MILSKKTLEKLRNLLNEETEYRSGPKIIQFFNQLGFNDSYGKGFPSRWIFTDERLEKINGTSDMDKCIKLLLSPANFIGNIQKLDAHIKDFNQYIGFDGWKIIREGKELIIVKDNNFNIDEVENQKEDDFIKKEIEQISLNKLGFDSVITNVLENRIAEIEKCVKAEAHLSVIFLCGSCLERILLGVATKNPKLFNQATSSPKNNEGNVKNFNEWSLSNLIDVACEIGFLKIDVKKFSHALREFRNYIHPFQQVAENFDPGKSTAILCWQVLKIAILELYNSKL